MKKLFLLLSLSFCCLCLDQSVLAYDLKAKPDVFFFQEVPVGKSFQFRVPLLVYNDSDKPASFILDTIKPSVIKSEWLPGYEEIPDPTWFGFSTPYVDVPAHSVENILMYVRIPKQEVYCNQHWVVSLAIREKTADNTKSNRYAYPKVYLETEKKKSLKKTPAGKLGTVPNVVLLTELKLGSNTNCGQFTLYNNDTISHTYNLRPTGEMAFGKPQAIFPTDGYQWLPHPEWINLKDSVTVNANKNREVKIDVNLPLDGSLQGKKYESLLFLDDGGGEKAFVRLLLEIL